MSDITTPPHASDLIYAISANRKPWLLAGKGPSLDKWRDELRNHFNIIAINHALYTTHAPIVHIMDYDNFTDIDLDRCGLQAVIMCSVPHWRRQAPTRWEKSKAPKKGKHQSLLDWMAQDCRLRQLQEDGMLYAYDGTKCGKVLYEDHEPLTIKGASGTPLLHLLASCGHKKVYTIGVDGGDGGYAKQLALKCVDSPAAYNSQMDAMQKVATAHGAEVKSVVGVDLGDNEYAWDDYAS